jgi:transglutaminase-like putative cysteine protease
MTVAAPFRRTVTVLVLLAVAAFGASQGDPWTAAVAGALAFAAIRLTEGRRPWLLPPAWLRAGVLLAIAWGGFEFATGLSAEGAPRVVGTVVLAALVLKLWSPKAAQDWRQVIALSIVLVVAASLSSMDPLVGALVVAFAAALVPAAMLYQLHAGEEAAARELLAALPAGAQAAVLRPPPDRAWLRQLRWLALAGIVAGAVSSAAVFLLFPRASLAGDGGGQARTSGFRGDISLWGTGRISLSPRVAMTVQLLDALDRPGMLVRPLHLRGAVLGRYSPESGTWSSGTARGAARVVRPPADGGFAWLAPEAASERSNAWTQAVEVRSLATERLFSAWLPLGVGSDEPRTFAFDRGSAEILAGGSALLGPPRAYRVRVQPFPSARMAQAVAGASPPAEASFPVAEVRSAAEAIVAARGSVPLPTAEEMLADPDERWSRNRRLAAIFAEHLSGSDFRYTTDLSGFRRTEGADPIVLFLERYRFGHCEHFASALAALCLSMGVEARVVTGFMTTEYDAAAERYVFRESGAHAWVEVRVGEWQWATFDASPMEELLAIQAANRSWVDRFRWALDPVEFAWNNRLASYDGRTQAELGARVAGGARSAGSWVAERAAELVDRTNRWFSLGPAGAIWLGSLVLVAAIAAVAAFVLTRRARRAARELSAAGASLPARIALGRDAGFYLDALDELARAGLAKPPGRTPLAHAEAIAAANPAASEAFARTVEAFYRLRYQGVPSRRRDRVRARLLVGRLRSALRGR